MSQQNAQANNTTEGDMSDVLEHMITETAMGFGAGLITQTLFGVATGTISTSTGMMSVLSGPLVVVLTVIGFGIGFARGWRRYRGR